MSNEASLDSLFSPSPFLCPSLPASPVLFTKIQAGSFIDSSFSSILIPSTHKHPSSHSAHEDSFARSGSIHEGLSAQASHGSLSNQPAHGSLSAQASPETLENSHPSSTSTLREEPPSCRSDSSLKLVLEIPPHLQRRRSLRCAVSPLPESKRDVVIYVSRSESEDSEDDSRSSGSPGSS